MRSGSVCASWATMAPSVQGCVPAAQPAPAQGMVTVTQQQARATATLGTLATTATASAPRLLMAPYATTMAPATPPLGSANASTCVTCVCEPRVRVCAARGATCSPHCPTLAPPAPNCSTWYSGPACDTVECPYNCYGHGTCNAQGQCSCNTAAGWGGIYCSKQETGPTVGVAQFIVCVLAVYCGAHPFLTTSVGTASLPPRLPQFTPPTYHVAEDTGTIYLNVSRGGSTAGTVCEPVW